MSRKLGSHLDSTRTPAKLTPGELEKSPHLSAWASEEWDKLLAELEKSGIVLAPAHRCTLVVCATLRADIRDCWTVIQANRGSNYCTAGTGAIKLHPAAARLDVLRRDLTKALALLGLQKPVPAEPEREYETLEEVLNG
jgi:hypothetical protein